jgi:hypothetical protein
LVLTILVSSHQAVLASLDHRRTKATSWHRRLLRRLNKSIINNRASVGTGHGLPRTS